MKEEYESDKIKDVFDEGAILQQLDFFYGGEHLQESFKRACEFLSLNDKNIGFADILCSDRGHNIMKNNSLSIHVESVNTFYQNFNKNESFCSFFLAQQDETKSIVQKESLTGTALKNMFKVIYLNQLFTVFYR